MSTGKMYCLEKLVDGKWWMQGMYTEHFIQQLACAVGELYQQGFEMYKSIRIVEVSSDAKPD